MTPPPDPFAISSVPAECEGSSITGPPPGYRGLPIGPLRPPGQLVPPPHGPLVPHGPWLPHVPPPPLPPPPPIGPRPPGPPANGPSYGARRKLSTAFASSRAACTWETDSPSCVSSSVRITIARRASGLPTRPMYLAASRRVCVMRVPPLNRSACRTRCNSLTISP